MNNIKIGFYISISKSLFDNQEIIYCYSNNDFEAISIITGECSCLWDLSNFYYPKNQKDLFNLYKNKISNQK